MSILPDICAEAWKSLRFHARRSILTMLGIAWGIATVVMLLAYGTGLERGVRTAFESFGTNLILVFPGRTSQQSGGEKAGKWIRLQREDVEFLLSNIPQIREATPEVSGNWRIAYGARFQEFDVSGVYPVYRRMRRMGVEEGRWISAADEAEHARIAVIGYEVRKRLFSRRPAVGEEMRIGGISFIVAGVPAKKIQDNDSPDNRRVFVPFSTMGCCAIRASSAPSWWSRKVRKCTCKWCARSARGWVSVWAFNPQTAAPSASGTSCRGWKKSTLSPARSR